jgi:hypothetical protein
MLYGCETWSLSFREDHRPRVFENRVLRRHVAHMEDGTSVYRFLIGRPKCRRPLGRRRDRWEDNIRMELRERGIDGANCIQMA